MEKQMIISGQQLRKSFRRGPETITPFADLQISIPERSFTALMGPSGSGKTTLLHCLCGIDRPDQGQLRVCGEDIMALPRRRLPAWRAKHIGCVFQQHHLLPVLTAVENVEVPLLLQAMNRRERRRRAHAALDIVGLADRAEHLPRQLSGGQEQRVAIARALVAEAPLIIGDEPTGDLDSDTGAHILALLRDLVDQWGRSVLMVTHDEGAARSADQCYHLVQGQLQERVLS
ncbi:MAG: ABC transporter ATP-binding protein [Planctomycetota bacterium]|nr:MAG: ABC transporter ATP-binding protein [Planctomycetota bacterium]